VFLSLSSVLSLASARGRLGRGSLVGLSSPVAPKVRDEKQRDGYLVHQLCSAEDSSLQGDRSAGTVWAYGAVSVICKHPDLYGHNAFECIPGWNHSLWIQGMDMSIDVELYP